MKRTQDQGHLESDKQLKKLEKQLKVEYRRAYHYLADKLQTYLNKFEVKNKEMLKRVDAGTLERDDYIEWRKNQVLQSKNYRALRDTLAADLANTNQIAAGIINENTMGIYALNMNYGTYEVESRLRINTSFALYSHETVENLMKKNPQIIPLASPSIKKDELWNRKKITSAITQGILTGESIPKIAKRLIKVTGMNQAASIRNARTYVTAAQNKGRVDSYKRMEKLGIDLEQEWMATVDLRTRPSHIALDGYKIKVGGVFPNGCRFPGDSHGADGEAPMPGEYYNCRCTLRAAFSKYAYEKEGRFERLPEGMTFEQWLEKGSRKTWQTQ